MSDSQADLRKRNLDFFEKAAPDVHARLTATDLREEARNFTPSAGGKIPSRRFTIPKPGPAELDRYTFDTVDEMLTVAGHVNIPVIDWPRSEQSYFLIVLGVHHQALLERMLEHTGCMTVLFIEPDPAALSWSLDHVDWPSLIGHVQKRGGTVDFVFDAAPQVISATVWRTMRYVNPVCTDGATFVAFGHPELANELMRRLGNDLALSYTSLGHFYDESLMLWNTYRNLARGDVRLFRRRHEKDPGCPVFVVASGPSLDDSIDVIGKHAGDAVIISCGSALRPLLVNGITPDFQIETENARVSPLTRQMADEHDLSAVTLVASTTIDPEVLPSFRDVIFYFRSSLSPYPLFAPSHAAALFMPDPTVGNAGMSFALELGFRDIFLFGMDCGSRVQDRHHSKDTYHYTPDAGDVDIRYDMQVEANFGGKSWTTYGLFLSLGNFTELLKIFGAGRTVRNCSDGALIPGAEPQPPSELSLPQTGGDKPAAVRRIIDDMPVFDGGADWQGETFAKAVHTYCERVRGALPGIEDYAEKAYQLRLMDLFQPPAGYFAPPPKGVEHSVNILMRGTLFCMLMFFERYLARVAYQDDFKRFGDIGVTALMNGLARLERDAVERFGGSEPIAPPPLDTVKPAPDSRLTVPPQPPRNSPCPCGSGKKFKHCHGVAA